MQKQVRSCVEITDINYDGAVARTESDEYVVIESCGSWDVDISNWRLLSGSNQSFTFPAGTMLQAGNSIRVYTNQVHPEYGGYSFSSKRSVWNNRGGTGKLFNAIGVLVSIYSYGDEEDDERELPFVLEGGDDKPTQDILDVLRKHGVAGCKVEATARAHQEKFDGTVDFLTALDRALKSLIEDSADGDEYNAATAVQENWDDGANADAAAIQKMIREHINGQKLLLLMQETLGEASESTTDTWVFELNAGMGDFHWVYVDRKGNRRTYQGIT
ncbi:MAG: lamin tail domain-containing protein [Nannocystaceae bacterium]